MVGDNDAGAVNSRRLNVFTAGVIAVLVMLSVILTASVLFPAIQESQIVGVLVGAILALMLAIGVKLYERSKGIAPVADPGLADPDRQTWRMPPLATLAPARLTLPDKVWMPVLRGYLLIAAGLLLAKLVQLAVGSS